MSRKEEAMRNGRATGRKIPLIGGNTAGGRRHGRGGRGTRVQSRGRSLRVASTTGTFQSVTSSERNRYSKTTRKTNSYLVLDEYGAEAVK